MRQRSAVAAAVSSACQWSVHSVVGGLRNEIAIVTRLLSAVNNNVASGVNCCFGGADGIGPTILPRLLLAVSTTLPVVCYSSVMGGLRK
jgi:hypothetical protein